MISTVEQLLAAVARRRAAGDDTWSMRELAAEVGISTRTVYRYFASRADLANAVPRRS